MKSMALGCVSLALLLTAGNDGRAQEKPVNGVTIQFNGKAVGGVESSTKNKDFKPVFEKELAALAEKLPGKPTLKLTHWYTVINGGAIHWEKGEETTGQKLKEALEKLPYIKSVEFDKAVGIPRVPKN
jgi:hypothetical protein